jgi:hypothetical protein
LDSEKENDASRKGKYYVAAGGSKSYNEGEIFFEGFSDTGAAMRNTMQIADVNRPLFAVREMKTAKNMVLFGVDDEHAVINKRTGKYL